MPNYSQQQIESIFLSFSRNVYMAPDKNFSAVMALAYLKLIGADRVDNDNINKIGDVSIRNKISSLLSPFKSAANEALLALADASNEDIKSFILSNSLEVRYARMDSETPMCIVELATAILDVQAGEIVMDYCSGTGSFLNSAYARQKEASYHGIEINEDTCLIAKIKAIVAESNISIDNGNVFEINDAKKYDKVFSNYPFGTHVRMFEKARQYVESQLRRCKDLSTISTADWLFNYKIMESLKDNGKAVVIMTGGGTWNSLDEGIRRYFLSNQYVESVISLPSNLFQSTAIPVMLFVLSHNNTSVKFIDASQMFVPGRRINTMTSDHISEIVSMYFNGGKTSIDVDYRDVIAQGSILNPHRYLTSSTENLIKNGVKFSEYIREITRGAPCTASDLDAITTTKSTNNFYLTLSNVKDGKIADVLPNLENIEPRLMRYCLQEGDIVLSKNGKPFKIAVAKEIGDKNILASGNLYVIRLNEKANPYFIKAFLDSEKGTTLLNSITVGSTIPNIPIEALRSMKVPNKTIEEQEEFANNYLARQDEIELLERKIQKLTSESNRYFDEEEI